MTTRLPKPLCLLALAALTLCASFIPILATTAPAPPGRASVRTSSASRARSSSHRRYAKPPALRAPTLSSTGSIAQAFRARLARAPFRGARVGVVVISLRDGRTLFESNANQLLMPASTMKVLTSAAALQKLGPDWTYRTPFLADAPPIGGTIAGNLYVKGTCAPDLVVEKFQELAQGLLAAGVRTIEGDVVGDLAYFDGEERPPEWPTGVRPSAYSAPISALAPNFSTVRVTVVPGTTPGSPAEVILEPSSEAVPLSGVVRTVKGRSFVSATRRLENLGGDTGVGNRIVVNGHISYLSGPWEKYLPIENPSGVAISAMKSAMQQMGIVVRGHTRIGTAPPGAVPIYTLPSAPLGTIVQDMNKHSSNFMAEMLLRTLGAESYGQPASREKGTQAVSAFLRTCGVDPDTITLTDGSGLSRSNLVTATTLARVLVRAWGDPVFGDAFLQSLPIGGIDGTLRGRMRGIEGRVRAKTGTIDGATTLAGYVTDASEGPIAFAFLVNGASHARAMRGLDDLCRVLCFPRAIDSVDSVDSMTSTTSMGTMDSGSQSVN